MSSFPAPIIAPPPPIRPRPYQREAADAALRWLREKDSCLVLCATGLGKSQPLSSRILTPTGWTTMGEVSPGDLVIGSSGEPIRVCAIFPQGVLPVYRVTFSDGTSTMASSDHLWSVRTKWDKYRGNDNRVMKTSELADDLRANDGSAKWFIPIVAPVQFSALDVPIDPYLLGILIGDGCFRGGSLRFSTSDDFILREVEQRLPPDVAVTHTDRCNYRITADKKVYKGKNPVIDSLRVLGLFGKGSPEKFIPDCYLYNSVAVRLAILQGLLDSDGHTRPCDGHTEFATTSRRLADDVCELVRSLGGVTRVREKLPGRHSYRGVKKRGLPSYRVTVTIDSLDVHLLPRKRAWLKKGKNQGQTKAIASIEPCGEEPCQCLRVDSPDSLYVTDDYILTHNTAVAALIALAFDPSRRVLVLVHRIDLIEPMVRALRSLCPDDVVEIEDARHSARHRGGLFDDDVGRIVVASKDSLCKWKRLRKWRPDEVGLIICDEVHHLSPQNKTFVRILRHFKGYKLVGLTATVDRLDGVGLGAYFQRIVYSYECQDAIEDGWLVPVRQQCETVNGWDLSAISRLSGGDFPVAQLDGILREEKPLQALATAALKYGCQGGRARPTLIFCVSVDHAEICADVINRQKPGSAEYLCGEDDPEYRKQQMERFARGEFQFLAGCLLFAEGFDEPTVEVIIMGRPTLSRILYSQMAGRGFRLHPTIVDAINDAPDAAARKAIIRDSVKPSLLLVDMVGASNRHRLRPRSAVDLLGGDFPPEVVEKAADLMGSTPGAKNPTQVLKAARQRLDDDERRRRREVVMRAELLSREVDPFDWLGVKPKRRTSLNRGRLASPKQIQYLAATGVPLPAKLSRKAASQLIETVKKKRDEGPPSEKMAAILRRYGAPVERMTFKEARLAIDALAALVW
jgi:superfamily II DNA or RNA helicase